MSACVVFQVLRIMIKALAFQVFVMIAGTLVLVLETHTQIPFFTIHLIILSAPKSEPWLFLLTLALKSLFSPFWG